MSYLAPTLNVLPLPTESANKSFDTTSIVIVDAAVNQYHYLPTSSHNGMEVHILNEQEDGITQILSLLQQHHQLSRIFLFCKGTSSQIVLGKTSLSETNLWIYADAIREWRNYFAQDAEILIHGYDLATNRISPAFVSWLGLLARACVQVL